MAVTVALLAEGVDRNLVAVAAGDLGVVVALLAEGVDRNFFDQMRKALEKEVALLAEGVDRNACFFGTIFFGVRSRPPRGGRG